LGLEIKVEGLDVYIASKDPVNKVTGAVMAVADAMIPSLCFKATSAPDHWSVALNGR
jgi:hypothetical protein